MTEEMPQRHRSRRRRPRYRHKNYKIHRAAQAYRRGVRPLAEGSGLRLPQWRFAPYPDFGASIRYPRGWKAPNPTLGPTAFLICALGLVLIGLCLALARIIPPG